MSLPWENGRIIKSLRQSSQMNLSHHCGLIPCGLQLFGKIILIPVKILDVIYFTIYKTMFSCKHYCSAWSTYRIGNKAFIKSGPFISNTINIWSVIKTMTISTYCLIGMIIRHDKNNVWGGLFFCTRTKKKNAYSKR